MFKYNKGVLPLPIINLFALNNERHNYNTRHNHDLQINTGNGELVYKFLAFMVYKYGIIYPKNHMHALRTYQNRTYKTMIYCKEYDKTLYYR